MIKNVSLMFLKTIWAVLVVFSNSPGMPTTVAQEKGSPAQTSFGPETAIKRPTKVPAQVLTQLLKETGEQIKRCEEFNPRQLAQSKYFAASSVNINDDSLPDLLVQAGEFCLQGAHNTPFWIFTRTSRHVEDGYRLVFKTQTDGLDIRKISTHGYRDIADMGHTAVSAFTTILKFDGHKYRPSSCTVEDLETKRTSRVACNRREWTQARHLANDQVGN